MTHSMVTPLVSVVVPVYNGADFIQLTLESVLGSTLDVFELIVVNDGSTDPTVQIVEDTLSSVCASKWRIVSQQNMGEARAVNEGVSQSRGKYLLILSADDIIAPKLLEKAGAFLESHPGIDVVYPDWGVIDEAGELKRTVRPAKFSTKKLIGELYCIPGPGTLIRKSAVSGDLRNPDFSLMSDLECWMRLAKKAEFQHLPGVLAFWREHDRSTTVKMDSDRYSLEILRLTKFYFSQPDLPKPISRLRRKAIARAFFVGGKGLRGWKMMEFLAKSAILDPISFLKFLRREATAVRWLRAS